MCKSKEQIVLERQVIVASVSLLAFVAAWGFSEVNRHAKGFEAAVDASKAATVSGVTVAAKPQPTATPSPVLYDAPLDADLQAFIIEECEKREVDPAVIIAMIERESQYTADAIGDNGNSFGLMQIQPRWHYQRMSDLGCTDLLDPYQNVTVGIDLLDSLLDRYDGDYGKALTAYNTGKYRGTVTEYANAVLDIAEELRGETE